MHTHTTKSSRIKILKENIYSSCIHSIAFVFYNCSNILSNVIKMCQPCCRRFSLANV
ncbi:hypothetical protein CHCC20375_2006 [Bacillus licheniformis]|nr:hypothetical protein CHCC20375_2006 [Bacillus licheniformis]